MWTASRGRERDSGFISPWPTGWSLSCAPALASPKFAAAAKRSWWWKTTTSCAAPSSVSSKRLGTRSSRQRTASRRSRRSARRRACGSCFRISSCPAWEGARCTTPRGGRGTPHRSCSPAATRTPTAPRVSTRPFPCCTSRGLSRICWSASGRFWTVQHLSDLPRQRVRHERLLEEGDAGVQDALADHRVVCITGRVEYLHAGPLRGQPLGELAAAHAGHHDVGHEDIDPAAVAGGELQRGRPVGGLEHPVAACLEATAGQRAHRRRVLDQQDGLVAAAHLLRL